MSSDPCADRTVIILDALSNGLNMSKLELMTLISPQAPLSNLLLVHMLKLHEASESTHIHIKNKIPIVPTAQGTPEAAVISEPEDDMYMEFICLYWFSLTSVISIVLLALWTKFTMTPRRSFAEWERESRVKPMTDVERWCMRRKMTREKLKEEREEAEKKEAE